MSLNCMFARTTGGCGGDLYLWNQVATWIGTVLAWDVVKGSLAVFMAVGMVALTLHVIHRLTGRS